MATSTRRTRTRSAAKPATTKSFADFDNGRTQQNGSLCPRCRESKRDGNVGIRLNRTEGGRYKQLTSRSIAMCETCCIEVYEDLMKTLESEANQSSS